MNEMNAQGFGILDQLIFLFGILNVVFAAIAHTYLRVKLKRNYPFFPLLWAIPIQAFCYYALFLLSGSLDLLFLLTGHYYLVVLLSALSVYLAYKLSFKLYPERIVAEWLKVRE